MKNLFKKIIVLLILLLIVGGGTVAYVYIATDMLKSDRQLFYKYVSKNEEIFDFFKDESLEAYYNKKQNTPYQNKGKYYVTGIEEYLPEKAKNMEIAFNGETDKANNYMYQQIKVNYNENTSMAISCVNNKDYYGIKIEEILKKYLTLENNNLKDFAKNLGVENLDDIPDKIDFENLKNQSKFSEEELEEIKKIVKNTLNENLTNDNFKSNKVEENDVYTLKLTSAQVVNILQKVIENLYNSEIITQRVKETYMSQNNASNEEAEEYVNNIKERTKEYIEKEENQEFENINFSISVFVKDKNLIKTEFDYAKTDNEEEKYKIILKKEENKEMLEVQSYEQQQYKTQAYVELEKTKKEDELGYNLSIKYDDEINISFVAKWTGIDTLENVNEQYSMETEENEDKVKYIFTNKNTFVPSINSQIAENEFMIVNKYNKDQLQIITNKLQSSLEQLNKIKMNQIEVEEDENPLLYYLPLFSTIMRGEDDVYMQAKEAQVTNKVESARERVKLDYMEYRTNLMQEQISTTEQISITEYLKKHWTESSDPSLYTVKDGVITLSVPDNDGNYITATFDEQKRSLVWSDGKN